MSGMEITVVLTNGTEQSGTWVDTSDPKEGGVVFSDKWQLTADVEPVNSGSGDGTFGDEDELPNNDDDDISSPNENWNFELLNDSLKVDKIIMDRGLSDIVFDTALGSINDELAGSDIGTAASQRGRNWYTPEFDNSSELDVDVLFTNQVTGTELYTRVIIDFSGSNGYNKNIGTSFDFGIDTDEAPLGSAPPPVVPEPGTIAVWSLLGLMGGVAMLWQKRRKKNAA